MPEEMLTVTASIEADYVRKVLEEFNTEREAEGKPPVTYEQMKDRLQGRAQDELYYNFKGSMEDWGD